MRGSRQAYHLRYVLGVGLSLLRAGRRGNRGPQDACATESMAPIVDRTKEHLGVSDSYVIQVRRFLIKAVKDLQAGKPLPGLVYDPAQADFAHIRCDVAYLPAGISWRTLFEEKSDRAEKT